MHSSATLPWASKRTPSASSSRRFFSKALRSAFPKNPPSALLDSTTLWHGTSGAKGFLRRAAPTARADPHPVAEATAA
jgi:hypothetical protein